MPARKPVVERLISSPCREESIPLPEESKPPSPPNRLRGVRERLDEVAPFPSTLSPSPPIRERIRQTETPPTLPTADSPSPAPAIRPEPTEVDVLAVPLPRPPQPAPPTPRQLLATVALPLAPAPVLQRQSSAGPSSLPVPEQPSANTPAAQAGPGETSTARSSISSKAPSTPKIVSPQGVELGPSRAGPIRLSQPEAVRGPSPVRPSPQPSVTPPQPVRSPRREEKPAPAAETRSTDGAEADPVIAVTIGRIEIRAVPPPVRPTSPRPTPGMTLEEYLQARAAGGRR
jgi:hypothetical protein